MVEHALYWPSNTKHKMNQKALRLLSLVVGLCGPPDPWSRNVPRDITASLDSPVRIVTCSVLVVK